VAAENSKTRQTTMEIILKPVGHVRSELKAPSLVASSSDIKLKKNFDQTRKEAREIRTLISELIINPGLDGILDGLEDFSHILVLYWPHLVPPEGRTLTKVHPIGRKDLPLVGVFSTCSPARPNPILVTAVRLLERNENVLKVQGLEAIDGSPIIDLKPYVPSYYSAEEVELSEWMMRINKEISEA